MSNKRIVVLSLTLAPLFSLGALLMCSRPMSAQSIYPGSITTVNGRLTCNCVGDGNNCGCTVGGG